MKVRIQERAKKDLKSVDRVTARRLLEKIARLQEYPDLPQIKRLKNHYPPFRMRVGDYRILFDVEGECLIVISIRHRKDAYRP